MLSFEPLRQLLTYRNIKIVDLINETGFSTATAAKINKDEPIQFDTLDKLCSLLDVPVEEILVFLDDEGNKKTNRDNNYEQLKLKITDLKEKLHEQEKINQDLLIKIENMQLRKEEKEIRVHIKPKKYLIKNLKGIRKAQGLKQFDISEAMGITSSYISMFEREQQFFNEHQLDVIKGILPIPEENIIEVE